MEEEKIIIIKGIIQALVDGEHISAEEAWEMRKILKEEYNV